MKTKMIAFLMVIGIFSLISLNAQVVELQWNTFLGGIGSEYGFDIVRDGSGNIYVTGYSYSTWGSPVNAHIGSADVHVAKLDESGNLLWNTFMGSIDNDWGYGITLDGSGNVYVTGYSWTSWGTPVNATSGEWDLFVAKLNSSGDLLWNTFLGSASADYGFDITADNSGNIYVSGYSYSTWGSPVSAHSGQSDVVVASLDSNGNLLWNTFLGSAGDDNARDIALDGSGNIYVAGGSDSSWGSPVNAHSGQSDTLVASLNNSGNLLWHTFLGSTSTDYALCIALDGTGNIYVSGESSHSWGSPVNAFSGGYDVAVACLDGSGNLVWNTFLGSVNYDYGNGIAVDGSGNVYVAGETDDTTWGSAANIKNGYYHAFVAVLDGSGNSLSNSFFGSGNSDYCKRITLDGSGHIYLTGHSDASWGTPVNAHSGAKDVFVAELFIPPFPDIVANGSDGPLSITESDSLQIRVSLNRFGSDENVDYWLAYKGPSGWMHYNNFVKKWESGLGLTHEGPLMDLNNKKVFQSSGLAPGNYTFYFGVDMIMNGKITKSSLFKDEVQVTVTSD